MTDKPLAIIIYAKSDDNYEGGKLSQFRSKLSESVRFTSGHNLVSFHDNDIQTGQQIQERISHSLSEAMVLVAILTPIFFTDSICRDILAEFQERERQLGRNDLVLAVYYKLVSELGERDEHNWKKYEKSKDPLIQYIGPRQLLDWRQFRGKDFESDEVKKAREDLAERIVALWESLQNVNHNKSLQNNTQSVTASRSKVYNSLEHHLEIVREQKQRWEELTKVNDSDQPDTTTTSMIRYYKEAEDFIAGVLKTRKKKDRGDMLFIRARHLQEEIDTDKIGDISSDLEKQQMLEDTIYYLETSIQLARSKDKQEYIYRQLAELYHIKDANPVWVFESYCRGVVRNFDTLEEHQNSQAIVAILVNSKKDHSKLFMYFSLSCEALLKEQDNPYRNIAQDIVRRNRRRKRR